MKRAVNIFTVLGLVLVLAACGGRKKPNLDIDSVGLDGGDGGSGNAVASGVIGEGIGGTGIEGHDLIGNPEYENYTGADKALLAERIVYFDFNSFALTPESEDIVRAHANFLVYANNTNVILEGHTDERGTREYNLALGEDRARAVSNVLQAYGVDPSRVEIVSYGEEQPDAFGSDEASYALNRRVVIHYQ